MISRLKCWVGWHAWVQSRPLVVQDAIPMHREPNPTRTCSQCGERQRWLPGYGGSEFGCWTRDWSGAIH